MVSQIRVARTDPPAAVSQTTERIYQQGIVAGMLGAVTIAVWFLLIDLLNGRPLYTPTVLGTALFRGPGAIPADGGAIDLEMVIVFSWVHFLAFGLIGGVASWLLAATERNANFGFGVILLFVVFEYGFIAVAMLFAEEVLEAMSWPWILIGNTLAAVAMAVYFRRQHPNWTFRP